uniref:G-protein coupled receptors family 1 profile domain-containing protein n=1 Tax=Panagrellus redivivus TaxID=6233 RepID=A0A7E5A1Y4_PANRE
MDIQDMTVVEVLHLSGYVSRLRINAVLAIIFNTFGIMMIIKCSPKAMKTYKYHLVHIVTIFIWLFGVHGSALMSAYISRLITLTDHGYLLKKKMTYFLMGCLHVFIAAPAIGAQFYASPERSRVLQYINETVPEFYDTFVSNACSLYAIRFEKQNFIFVLIAVLTLFTFAFVILFITLCVFRLLRKSKAVMSNKTATMHRELILTLIVQTVIPVACLVVPCVTMLVAASLKAKTLPILMQFAFQIMTLHSTFNMMAVLILMKPYRDRILLIFSRTADTPPVQHNISAHRSKTVSKGPSQNSGPP